MMDPGDLGSEALNTAKAIAKAAGQGLEIVKNSGAFVSRFIGGSLEQAFGIIEDKLKYTRWERQVRLVDRASHFMDKRGSRLRRRAVPRNVAIPIFEAASLEEDDDLQDLWARLLVNAADAESGVEVKRGFVSILQDLGHMEVRLLQKIHDAPPKESGVPTMGSPGPLDVDGRLIAPPKKGGVATKGLPNEYLEPGEEKEDPGLPSEPVQIGLWNLMRLGCIESAGTWDSLVGIRRVNITALGKALVHACSTPPD
ncbi:MAG: Abi-alpha family protein [Nitrospira sp.]|nr:Abi-alpha family protein [Nitrospira sp.]